MHVMIKPTHQPILFGNCLRKYFEMPVAFDHDQAVKSLQQQKQNRAQINNFNTCSFSIFPDQLPTAPSVCRCKTFGCTTSCSFDKIVLAFSQCIVGTNYGCQLNIFRFQH